MEHILFILKSNQFLKASIKYGVRDWELHKSNLILTVFLCNRVGDECGSSHTLVFFSVFILTTKRTRKQVPQNISNNRTLFNDKCIGALHDWKSNMMRMKTWNNKDAPNLFLQREWPRVIHLEHLPLLLP